MEKNGNSNVKLLGRWPSPYTLRVHIALRFKSVDYEYIEETMNPKSELLLKSNPVHKKIPVLFHNDEPICESNVIVEYIDEAFSSGSSILPSDPYDRAIHRFWVAYLDNKCFPGFLQSLKGCTTQEKEAMLLKLKEALALLEENFNKLSKGKSFFGGDEIGYLDIALGGFLGWLIVYEKLNAVKLFDEATTPSLVAWRTNFLFHEAVKGVMPEIGKLIGLVSGKMPNLKARTQAQAQAQARL